MQDTRQDKPGTKRDDEEERGGPRLRGETILVFGRIERRPGVDIRQALAAATISSSRTGR